jgi:NAD(P)-dependent dehydrogenase (short-subunit alcohol dehydrogenase family)
MSKAVVVTGASTGIGFATSVALAKAGYDVFAGVRSAAAGEPLIKASASTPGKITPIQLEVTDAASVAAAAAQVKSALGGEPLFGLVNNAGIAHGGPLLYQPIDDIRQVFEVNVIGLLRVTQAFAPMLAATATSPSRPGRVINISSVGGKLAAPFVGAYAGSKHAVEGLSEALRRELMVFGIDVIIIGPGAVVTPIWDKAEAGDLAYLAGTAYEEPARRFYNYFITSGRQGLKPEKLGAAVLKALTVDKPKTRYAVLKGALTNWTLPRLLPKRTVDNTFAKNLGLTPKVAAAK